MKRLFEKIKKFSRQHRGASIVAVFTMLLVLGISVESVMAYFTTYATAKGGMPISLAPTTTVHEDFADWKKTIQIENTGETDCFIRVKVIAGSEFSITAAGSGWSEGSDGYWYYSNAVPSGGMTDALVAEIHYPEGQERDFNVVVIHESVPVVYSDDGTAIGAKDADWSMDATYVEEAE